MSCDAIVDRLPEALTAHAVPSDVAGHLAACGACRAEAEAVRGLLERVRGALEPIPEVAPPPLAAILAAARAESPEPVPAPTRSPGLLRAAALLLAAGLGALADRTLLPPAPPAAPARVDLHLAAREAVAERPGSLGASLAVLGALSSPRQETGAPR